MGCSSSKTNASMPVIEKKMTITEKFSMNPHDEDGEAEVLHEGKKINDKLDSHELSVASKLNKNESKSTFVEAPLSQTVPVVNVNSSLVERQMGVNITVYGEKPNFPIHEHKFEFDFVDEERLGREKQDKSHQDVEDVLKELDNI
ncbi:hypothetical protein SteCoe_17364 [Stentor coeruleus]|uniref:Uncharacterized protein n=1 Tax=Stentor coeruleus TaxID=5963 RepID=A0A1R2BZD0_9CILI|nr:hypothetical protein SteCoe_17364 [Stentor coeruleus]